jgi:putative transposase
VIYILKSRRKTQHGQLQPAAVLGGSVQAVLGTKESPIEEGHPPSDHVHMMSSIPPKHAVSQAIWFIKGKEEFVATEVPDKS